MQSRITSLLVIGVAGILVGAGVTFGPWISSLFVDDPTIDVDGPLNVVLIILGVLFAAPSILLVTARRRFATSRAKSIVAAMIGVAITLFELLMVAIMVTDDSGDGQVALILIVPIPFALLAMVVLGIMALVGGRPAPTTRPQ